MARIAALGRRVAPRDAVPSGKRRNASSAATRATEGRDDFCRRPRRTPLDVGSHDGAARS